MTSAGIRAALDAGVGGVVAKSINESPAAARQLDQARYVQLDETLHQVPWGGGDPGDSLFCRSGLAGHDPTAWFHELALLDRAARRNGQFVAGSIVLGSPDGAIDMAAIAERAGLRVLELNVGAPHGEEAAAGAITNATAADPISKIVQEVRKVYFGQLWVKLSGVSSDPTALAIAARRGGADAVGLIGRSLGMVPDLETMRPIIDTSAAYGGRWALPITCRWLALTRRASGGRLPMLGTNGARDGHDAARMMLAGACAVQMTSAVFQAGFAALSAANSLLEEWLDGKRLHAGAIVGRAADALQTYAEQPEIAGHWREIVPPGALERPPLDMARQSVPDSRLD